MKVPPLAVAAAVLSCACVFDAQTSPDARVYDTADGAPVPWFRDAGCSGSLSGVSGADCGDGGAPSVAEPDATPPCGRHTFRYVDGLASSVWLTGSFTDWAAVPPGALPMLNDGVGNWSLVVEPGPGSHSYKLIVNGDQWVTDPANPVTEPDGVGGQNSVVVLCGGPE